MNKIKELKAGQEGVLIEALIINVVTGKTNGANRSTYLSLALQDDTGSIDAKLWAATQEQVDTIVTGSVVQIKGDIIKYNDDRQMKVIKLVILSKDPQEQVKYLKSAPESKDVLVEEIFETMRNIENVTLRNIVGILCTEHKDQLEIYPAASKNHHEYVSGLVHHTVSMLRLAKSICALYPSIDSDLLYSGIILHDLGKIVELSGPVLPEYTLEGKLLGHISISQAMIKQVADNHHLFGEEVTLLQHMILSHHGKLEFGSPVVPLIKEAEVLSFIDNLDARINMLDKALDLIEPGENTKRVFSLENRSFYKPKFNQKENDE
ncbi:HD domain-containing protein [Tannockella kyphosi]|uniref:HD domain-containing protein n=1 Tax=Tannockella kyphosi TaxID=2899121 RepID=UPI0020115766|nr:HD domain-containing protein [Tannockella kyphosi]